MKAGPAVAFGPDAPRASFIVPRSLAVFVAGLSLTLLAIGATSPYTHSNLLPGYDRGYTRTDQIVVGASLPYGTAGERVDAGDAVATGERLFVAEGCVTCHGLGGRGGVVGPAIEHNDAATLRQRTRVGSPGMPRFAETLADDQIAAISAYLRSLHH